MSFFQMLHIDYSINLPTVIIILSVTARAFNYLSEMRHKIDTMWEQFLVDNPEHERRERMRAK